MLLIVKIYIRDTVPLYWFRNMAKKRGRKKRFNEPLILKTIVLPQSLYNKVQEVSTEENWSELDTIRYLIREGHKTWFNNKINRFLPTEEKAINEPVKAEEKGEI